jgi:hypothetical protein
MASKPHLAFFDMLASQLTFMYHCSGFFHFVFLLGWLLVSYLSIRFITPFLILKPSFTIITSALHNFMSNDVFRHINVLKNELVSCIPNAIFLFFFDKSTKCILSMLEKLIVRLEPNQTLELLGDFMKVWSIVSTCWKHRGHKILQY